jgi:type VI protein secretion system component VasA
VARGREIEITIDAARMPGGACLMLAAVIDHYLRLSAPLGAFFRVAFRTSKEGPAWRLPTATTGSSSGS